MAELVRLGSLLPAKRIDGSASESGQPQPKDDWASIASRLAKAPCRKCRKTLGECMCQAEPFRRRLTLEDLRVRREHMDAALEDFDGATQQRVLAVLASPEKFRGGLIGGTPGTGKTRLLVLACKLTLERSLRPVIYHARALFRRLSAVFEPNAQETEQRVIDDLAGSDLLAIDDLGHEGRASKDGKANEFVLGALHEIIDERHGNYRPTLISTNLDLVAIGERYDQAIASRVGSWLPIVMTGADRRLA